MFEEKWLEARKKAHEAVQPNGKPATVDKRKDEKKAKKKKSKRDGRKDKKKRGKKRKRGSSSSSSDSDSDSSSGSNDSQKESDNEENKTSIRVQMRNVKKGPVESDDRNSRWTMVSAEAAKPVPPPAPTFSKSSVKDKKKDEQIIGQWNTLEPVISAEEKRLLESLKGKLKNQQPEPAPVKAPAPVVKKVEEKAKPRERSRDNSIDRREKSRSRDRRSRDRRDRSRSRGYRSRRSRSRSRSRSRGRYRRYSRSRSNSRGRRRVERPIVNFPEPRLPPTREDKKLPARSYVISKKEDTSANAKKVMPMIGKMPVFKKQLSDKKAEDPVEETVAEEPVAAAEQEQKPRDDTWDDYMPDPMQYSALMGAPPPPPQFEEEPEVVPPGLDPEQDSEFIPQPISDAPIARKGPLPKDFQDTLDLLYDGDTPKPVHIEPKPLPEAVPIEPPPMAIDPDVPQMISAEDLSQHNLLYGGYFEQQHIEESVEHKPPTPPEEPKQVEPVIEDNEAIGNAAPDDDEDSKNQGMDMDELAMLGIDVNDVGSGFW